MRFRRLVASSALWLAAIVGMVAPSLRAQEQSEPIAIVSIAPLDRLISDMSYLLQASNAPELVGLVTIMTNQYTQGMDRTKPIGAVISMEGPMPNAIIFMPMNDHDQFFGALAGMGIEPDDLGDGLFEIDANGQTIFARDVDGWMYISQSEASLSNVPANPGAMLGGLPNRYDLAVKLNIQALPEDAKSMMTEQLRVGFERGMAEQAGQSEAEKAAAREMGEASIEQIERMVNETQEVIVGWAADKQEQKTYFDGAAIFVEGTQLAENASYASEQTSDFTSFILPGAAARLRYAARIPDGDKVLAKNNLRTSLTQMETQLDQLDVPDEVRSVVLDFAEGLIGISEKTIDEGLVDGAASLSVGDDTLRILVGGRIADGAALAEEFKQVLAKMPAAEGAPEAEFDYDTYKGITLHRLTVPIKIADPGAKKVFGDELLITIGTGEKSFMVALDPSGDASLKAAIDRMLETPGVKTNPFESVIQLEQILRFAQAVSPNSILDNAVNTMSQYSGKDRVSVSASAIPRGISYRMSIEEGVLRSIGAAVKGGGGGGF